MLDQMPAQAVSDRPDSVLLQQQVVSAGELVVTRRVDEVKALTGAQPMGRTFEAPENEALEQTDIHVLDYSSFTPSCGDPIYEADERRRCAAPSTAGRRGSTLGHDHRRAAGIAETR